MIYNTRGVRDFKSIDYYSWFLMLTCTGAFLCLIPRAMWKMALLVSPVKLESYMEELENIIATPFNQREKGIAQLCDRVMEDIETRREPISIFHHSLFSVPAPDIVFYDILKKALYVGNFALQLYVSYSVFDHGLGPAWPVKYLSNLWYGVNNNDIFPNRAYCEFNVFSLYGRETPRRLLQCELSLNSFAKIATIFHWFWMSFFGAIAVYDSLNAFVRRFNKCLLENILYLNKEVVKDDEVTRALVNRFEKTIPQEFVFVLKYMNNTHARVAQRAAYYLYDKWLTARGDDDHLRYRKIVAAPQPHHFTITARSVHVLEIKSENTEKQSMQQAQSLSPTATTAIQIEMMP